MTTESTPGGAGSDDHLGVTMAGQLHALVAKWRDHWSVQPQGADKESAMLGCGIESCADELEEWLASKKPNAEVSAFLRAPIDEDLMPAADAMRYADLWAAGKMIGGDVDAVCLSLRAEVLRLRAALADQRERLAILCDQRAESTTIDERDATVWVAAAAMIREIND